MWTIPAVSFAPLVTAGACLACACLVTAAFVLYYRQLRQTTLLAAAWWAVAVFWSFAAVEGFVAWGPFQVSHSWVEPLRLSAAALTFCPLMAVLGGKRPQHRAWQFIVASLWVVLVLPAAEKFFLQSGQALQMSLARQWFLLILIAVGVGNYALTRYCLSASLCGVGQALCFWNYLPGTGGGLDPALGAAAGLAALTMAAMMVIWTSAGRSDKGCQRMWFDFRDLYGAMWGLRLIERINSLAVQNKWDMRLTWRGFQSADGKPLPELSRPLEDGVQLALKNFLRRFVNAQWLDERGCHS